MSVAPWLKGRGPQLRTPSIEAISSKLQETQNFCSLSICRVVSKELFLCVLSSDLTTNLVVQPAVACVKRA